ncbi:outer membrane porin GjpA [Mycobacterium sp. M1]|uniref:Outer membrane porin GjpA n=1 Tax=Mycolicibacter acidiphilus TaxID=2835306 RepID=A0ABS5RPC0_9MYCO|nr:outer membrane porin GjpA [Mycolicibacter acidiphilus]MBS9536054.1 outer membrane porin GjpA [Mycolicibacter acidiphilus]
MQQALRPYATAGLAIVGAGLLVAGPQSAVINGRLAPDVQLTSALGDLLAPWIAQYNEAADNASVLANNFLLAPGVASQQFAVEVTNFLASAFKNPSDIPALSEQLQDHLKAAASSVSLSDASSDVIKNAQAFTLAGDHGGLVFGNLASFLPSSIDPNTATEIINFLESPQSGIIMGMLGPAIAPWVALSNSISDGDNFNETMANMVGAYYNGATLNLDSVLPAINDAGLLPAGMEVHHLSFAFGGLLTPGDVSHAAWDLFNNDGSTFASVPVVGGSIFNSLGIDIIGVPLLNQVSAVGHGIGPLGAMQSLSELIAQELGASWNVGSCEGKGCTPVLPPASPPGSIISFPHIPTDTFGDSGSAAAAASDSVSDTNFWSELSDAFTNFQWNDVF